MPNDSGGPVADPAVGSVGGPAESSPVWSRPRLWLAAMVVGFFAVSVYVGYVSYVNFQLTNPTDAGIIGQAVASAAHGHVAPFYEYWDCLHKSRCSFLLVHPAFVLYSVEPVYLAAPSTFTLFVVRSAMVAGAAVPLYWLTRQVTHSSGKSLLAAGLYLVWAPTLAGDAFSLHLESMFPIELFTLAALWQAGRYRLALAVALATFLTYEVSPLFVFLVGLFFLAPYLDRAFRDRWRRWRSERRVHRSARWTAGLWLSTVRDAWREREVRYLAVLMGASVAAYLALELFINLLGCHLLGVTCPSIAAGLPGAFGNPSSPGFHSLGAILASPRTVSIAEYWLILYALVAFLPLLSPRALILSVPWIGWTFLTISANFATIGREYSLIAAGPIFIGLAYGLVRIPESWFHPRPRGDSSPAPDTTRRPALRRFEGRGHGRAAWIGVLTAVVVANAVVLPINPLVPDLGIKAGAPFFNGYFDHSLTVQPGFSWVEQLLELLPPNAVVIVPAAVLPLIAGDPHAYVAGSAADLPYRNLPFNLSGGPEYAVVTSAPGGALGPNLSRNVSNPLLYGLRGYAGITPLGPLLLYERNETEPPTRVGPPLPPTHASLFPGEGIIPGPKGVVALNASAPNGMVIQNVSGVDPVGRVWGDLARLVAPGNYTFQLQIAVSGTGLATHPDAAAVRVEADGFGATLLNDSVPGSAFVPGAWTNFTWNLTVSQPVPEVEFVGSLLEENVSVAVAAEYLLPT